MFLFVYRCLCVGCFHLSLGVMCGMCFYLLFGVCVGFFNLSLVCMCVMCSDLSVGVYV